MVSLPGARAGPAGGAGREGPGLARRVSSSLQRTEVWGREAGTGDRVRRGLRAPGSVSALGSCSLRLIPFSRFSVSWRRGQG